MMFEYEIQFVEPNLGGHTVEKVQVSTRDLVDTLMDQIIDKVADARDSEWAVKGKWINLPLINLRISFLDE
jgi:hypothetical protein